MSGGIRRHKSYAINRYPDLLEKREQIEINEDQQHPYKEEPKD
jgi:hypothetical protein